MRERADFDLGGLLAALRKRAWLVIAVTVSAATLAVLISQLQDDRYEATADLLFRAEANANAPERTAATNLALANLDAVVVGVRRRLDSDLPLEELRDRVELQPRGQADLVQIAASAETATGAASLANAFAAEVVAVRRRSAGEDVQRRVDSLDARLSQTDRDTELHDDLVQRRKALLVDKALATGDVEVADSAAPPLERAAPRPVRNAGVAAVLGLIVAVMLIAVLRALDRRLTSEEAVELFGAPLLARVPVNGRKPWRQQLYGEAFQFLRANLLMVMANEDDAHAPGADRAAGRVIVVTSPLPAEGKSSLVARLGEALAAAGTRVTAIDCDLRKPTLADQLGLPGDGAGLAEVLLDTRTATDVVRETSVRGLSVLPSGAAGGFDIQLAGPRRLLRIIDVVRHRAAVVLVDTAPVAIAAETSILAAEASGVIVVLDARRLDPDTLTATRDQLQRAGAKVIGLVLNFAEAPNERALRYAYRGPYQAPWTPLPHAAAADDGERRVGADQGLDAGRSRVGTGKPQVAAAEQQPRPTAQRS